ncbi:MAG: hypothetical protein AABX88_02620, partial [Nanoarchaeota archaeon]
AKSKKISKRSSKRRNRNYPNFSKDLLSIFSFLKEGESNELRSFDKIFNMDCIFWNSSCRSLYAS